MKHSKFTLSMLAVICASMLTTACVSNSETTRLSPEERLAQSDSKYTEANQFGYLERYKADIADAEFILPKPPKVTEPIYFNDWYAYYQNKKLRDTPRGEQARYDVLASAEFLTDFSDVFGMKLSEDSTPAIWHLLQRACSNFYAANSKAKKHHKRIRPFVQFNDNTGFAIEEEHGRTTFSYPSNHTALGWGAALILSEINPDRQNEIMKKGYEFGQSRVILGYHYQSDVNAARLVSSMTMASLHSDPEFNQDMEKARAEFRQKSAKK